jgi:hypothetical protein
MAGCFVMNYPGCLGAGNFGREFAGQGISAIDNFGY